MISFPLKLPYHAAAETVSTASSSIVCAAMPTSFVKTFGFRRDIFVGKIIASGRIVHHLVSGEKTGKFTFLRIGCLFRFSRYIKLDAGG